MNTKSKKSIDSHLKQWVSFLRSLNNESPPEDRWLTIPEICSLLRCSEPTIYRKLQNKDIPFSKPAGIMIWLSDVAEYVINKEKFKR